MGGLYPHYLCQHHSNLAWKTEVLLISEVFCIGKLHEPTSSHVVASDINWRLSGTTSGTVAQSLYRKLSAGLEGSASLAAPYSASFSARPLTLERALPSVG